MKAWKQKVLKFLLLPVSFLALTSNSSGVNNDEINWDSFLTTPKATITQKVKEVTTNIYENNSFVQPIVNAFKEDPDYIKLNNDTNEYDWDNSVSFKVELNINFKSTSISDADYDFYFPCQIDVLSDTSAFDEKDYLNSLKFHMYIDFSKTDKDNSSDRNIELMPLIDTVLENYLNNKFSLSSTVSIVKGICDLIIPSVLTSNEDLKKLGVEIKGNGSSIYINASETMRQFVLPLLFTNYPYMTATDFKNANSAEVYYLGGQYMYSTLYAYDTNSMYGFEKLDATKELGKSLIDTIMPLIKSTYDKDATTEYKIGLKSIASCPTLEGGSIYFATNEADTTETDESTGKTIDYNVMNFINDLYSTKELIPYEDKTYTISGFIKGPLVNLITTGMQSGLSSKDQSTLSFFGIELSDISQALVEALISFVPAYFDNLYLDFYNKNPTISTDSSKLYDHFELHLDCMNYDSSGNYPDTTTTDTYKILDGTCKVLAKDSSDAPFSSIPTPSFYTESLKALEAINKIYSQVSNDERAINEYGEEIKETYGFYKRAEEVIALYNQTRSDNLDAANLIDKYFSVKSSTIYNLAVIRSSTNNFNLKYHDEIDLTSSYLIGDFGATFDSLSFSTDNSDLVSLEEYTNDDGVNCAKVKLNRYPTNSDSANIILTLTINKNGSAIQVETVKPIVLLVPKITLSSDTLSFDDSSKINVDVLNIDQSDLSSMSVTNYNSNYLKFNNDNGYYLTLNDGSLFDENLSQNVTFDYVVDGQSFSDSKNVTIPKISLNGDFTLTPSVKGNLSIEDNLTLTPNLEFANGNAQVVSYGYSVSNSSYVTNNNDGSFVISNMSTDNDINETITCTANLSNGETLTSSYSFVIDRLDIEVISSSDQLELNESEETYVKVNNLDASKYQINYSVSSSSSGYISYHPNTNSATCICPTFTDKNAQYVDYNIEFNGTGNSVSGRIQVNVKTINAEAKLTSDKETVNYNKTAILTVNISNLGDSYEDMISSSSFEKEDDTLFYDTSFIILNNIDKLHCSLKSTYKPLFSSTSIKRKITVKVTFKNGESLTDTIELTFKK